MKPLEPGKPLKPGKGLLKQVGRTRERATPRPRRGVAQRQTIYCATRERLRTEVRALTNKGYRVREDSAESVFLTYHSFGKPLPHVLWALFTVLIGNVVYALVSYAATRHEVWVRVGELSTKGTEPGRGTPL